MSATLNDLYIKLQAVGITSKPTIAQLVKLLQSREYRKIRGQQLAAANPITAERTGLMLWAKANKNVIDAQKMSLEAKAVTTTRTRGGQPFVTTRYVVPPENKSVYSAWVQQAATNSGTLNNYIAEAQNQRNVTTAIKQINDTYQARNPPQYMTKDIETYIRRMFYKGDSGDVVQAYLSLPTVQARLVTGKLDKFYKPIIKGTRGSNPLPIPTGVKPIVRTLRKK